MSATTMVEDARRARVLNFSARATARRSARIGGSCLHAPAGTPAWYGAVTGPPAGRYLAMLEHVSGPQLAQVGTFSTWERTAAWIARFHRAFAPLRVQQLAKRSDVLVYDAQFYWRWLRRAQRFAARDSVERRDCRRHRAAIRPGSGTAHTTAANVDSR